MESLKCEATGCLEVKRAADMSTCIALMQLHQKNVHETRDARQKPPKINRPSLQQDIGEDDWAAFTRRWEMFRSGTDLGAGQITPHLLACCEPELEAALFREDPTLASRTEEEVLDAMKRLTVLRVALSVRRATLLQTKQDPGEHVRQYVARLRGLANVCQWTKTGDCTQATCQGTISIDYSEDIVKLVLLSGLVDDEIRKEVLGTVGVDTMTLSDTVDLVDSKETASRAMVVESPKVAASSYKKMGRGQLSSEAGRSPNETDKVKRKIRCQCGCLTPQFGKVRGRLREFKRCLDCWKKNNPRTHASSQQESSAPAETLFHYVATTDYGAHVNEILPHPILKVIVTVDIGMYNKRRLPSPPKRSTKMLAIADSGA